LEFVMTAFPHYPIETSPRPDRLDFYCAIADRVLVGEIPADGACTRAPALERRLLRPVWYGDSERPVLVERARRICRGCPVLEACRRYATDDLVEHGVLAGLTAAQRRATWTREDRRALRRHKVRALYEVGATVAEMAEVLKTPQRTIEADIAVLGPSGSRRRRVAP
jgi:hypothetical protein